MSSPTHSWFCGPERVSLYADGTVEIQSGGRAYRATFERWVACAEMINMLSPPEAATRTVEGSE